MRALGAALVVSLALCHGSAVHAEEFFGLERIESQGRSVAAELAELNGDARTDLMVVTLLGIPPREKRAVPTTSSPPTRGSSRSRATFRSSSTRPSSPWETWTATETPSSRRAPPRGSRTDSMPLPQ
jgi:hypothetical protein